MFRFNSPGKLLYENRHTVFAVLILAGVVRLATAIFNIGFLAVDDYYMLYFSVPAQLVANLEKSVGSLVNTSYIRSPIPEYIVHYLARGAFWIGFHDPVNQIRTIYAIFGLFSLITPYFGWKIFKYLKKERLAFWTLLALSFHFLIPFVSTRVLIESMSVPFVMISAYYFVRYNEENLKRDLGLTLLWLGIASMFRFQDGVMAPAIVALILYKKRYRHLVPLSLFGVGVILLTGLPDLIIRGVFHESLYKYIEYNLYHSSDFGVSPVWAYLPTILGATFAPFLIARYAGFSWKERYGKMTPLILYIAIFIVVHSMIPHKEDRFLIPILPLMLMAALPMFYYLVAERKAYLRFYAVLALNMISLGLLTFFTSQNNVIALVRMVQQHPRVKSLVVFENSVEHIPISYAYAQIDSYRVINRLQPPVHLDQSCKEVLVVRDDFMNAAMLQTVPLHQVAVYRSNPLDRLVLKMNPKKNKRRGDIHVYMPRNCSL